MRSKQRASVARCAGRFFLLLALCLGLLPAPSCLAHPMGNFSVNHYSRITLEKNDIRVQYYIDLAEIPTYQELQQYNLTPGDTAGQAHFLSARGAELEHGISVSMNGTRVPLHTISSGVIFPPGAGGLPTMKMGYVFTASYSPGVAGSTALLDFADTNYPGHAGWKEIIVVAPLELSLVTAAASKDRSAGLSNYPTDMLNSPPQDLATTARFTLPSVAAPTQSPALAGVLRAAVRGRASSTALAAPVPATAGVTRRDPRVLDALGSQPHHLAQAPEPGGHSVTPPQPQVMPSQPMPLKANRQGTARDAFTQLVTTQHLSLWFLCTAAFISAGLGALHALEPGHGKTIVAAYLVGSRGTTRHAMLLGIIVTMAHTASVFALGGVTLYAARYILPEQLYPWLGLLSGLTIAALGGYMFLRRWTGEDMDHDHTAGAMHGHWFTSKRKPAPVAPATAVPKPFNMHAADTRKGVSLLQLVTLGITGGIIPCPAALVVLLSAFALHRVGFGFFLITAFSIGLATVLISFGLLMVYARQYMSRFQIDGPLTRRWLPIASACFMSILGIVIAVRAFATTGIGLHTFSQQKLGPALFVAGLGLVLGIRHSTDTDHVVAISTIVTRQRSIRGAALIGSMWGLGHTLTIFVVGCLIILCGVVIPPRVGLSMEFSVALMLILLGLLNLTGVMQKIGARFRLGQSGSGNTIVGLTSADLPSSEDPACLSFARLPSIPSTHEPASSETSRRWSYQLLRPLAIGLVHGLAGSAAVALLVLSTIHNPLWAIVYLLIFGGGTLLGMMGMTATMALPLVYAGDRVPRATRFLSVASGLVSVCFGAFLVYQLGYVGGLFTSHPHWTPQ